MLKLSRILAAAALSCAFAAPVWAQNIATVNGTPIPQSLADSVASSMAKQQGQPVTPQLKAMVKNELISREVMVQEADKLGLDKEPAVQDEIRIQRQNILIRALFSAYLQRHPITDAQIKAKYDEFAKNFGSTEYKAQHILVPSEKEAQDIITQLKKGAKFSDLAMKYSKDTGSAAKGGDLGWSSPANYVPPFAKALEALKPGQYTQAPVQSQYGWHIIKLDAIRPAKPPTMEQLKPQIQSELQREEVSKYQNELRSKAKITE
ncbi:MAG: peptidylprolyl isomerase [Thiomonas sp.]